MLYSCNFNITIQKGKQSLWLIWKVLKRKFLLFQEFRAEKQVKDLLKKRKVKKRESTKERTALLCKRIFCYILLMIFQTTSVSKKKTLFWSRIFSDVWKSMQFLYFFSLFRRAHQIYLFAKNNNIETFLESSFECKVSNIFWWFTPRCDNNASKKSSKNRSKQN